MILKSVLAAILALAVYREDKPVTPEKSQQLASISAAVHAVAKTPDEAAFLLAWGDAESKFSLRIHRGHCYFPECDRGRARGPWQVHRFAAMTDAQWDRMHGVEHIREQAEVAAGKARWAIRECRGDIRGAFVVLGGRACSASIPGVEERVATYRKVRSKL